MAEGSDYDNGSSIGTDGSDDVDDVELCSRLCLSSDRPPPPPPPPLCVLRAHEGDVQAVALSPCGKFLYSGDSDGLLVVWDVEDRRPAASSSGGGGGGAQRRLHPPDGGVLGLHVATDGRANDPSFRLLLLLSQGREGTLKLWRLGGEGGEVLSVDSSVGPGRCCPSSSSSNPSSSSLPPRPIATTVTGSKGFCVLSAIERPEALTVAEEEEEEQWEEDDDDDDGDGGDEEEEDEEEKHPLPPPPPLYAAVASEDAASVRVFDARRGEAEPLCELSEAEAAAAAAPSSSPSPASSAEAPKSRGMAMAVSLFFVSGASSSSSSRFRSSSSSSSSSCSSSSSPLQLCALVGYEDGSVVLWRCLKEREQQQEEEVGRERRGLRRRRRRWLQRRPREMVPAVEALSSLRVHFDAVTAVAGPVSFPEEEEEDEEEKNDTGGRSPLVLRFFSGGADSVLASYEVRIEGEEEEREDEIDESNDSGEEKTKQQKKKKVTLRAGPAVKLPARGVGALAVSRRGGEEALVAAGGWDGAIRLLALKRGKSEGESGDDAGDDRDSTSAAPRPRRRAFALEPLGELEHHVAPVASLSFGSSPVEGELLASGGRDGSIALWAGLV